MSTKAYFAYGSNMNPGPMSKRCPKAKVLGQASLEGWRLCFNRRSRPMGGGVAGIRRSKGDRVLGVLFEIGPDCLKALDRYEGFYGEGHPGNHYRRITVSLRYQGQFLHRVICYEAIQEAAHITPSRRYLSSILSGARAHELPDTYIQRILSIAAGAAAPSSPVEVTPMDPLLKKLRFQGQTPVLLLNAPAEFKKTAAAMKTSIHGTPKGSYAFVLAFAKTMAEAEKAAKAVAKVLGDKGIFWLAYPKGSSKKYKDADINRDSGHARMATHGFDGVSLVAIDEDWSAMRFLARFNP